jgi:hypothetical protein
MSNSYPIPRVPARERLQIGIYKPIPIYITSLRIELRVSGGESQAQSCTDLFRLPLEADSPVTQGSESSILLQRCPLAHQWREAVGCSHAFNITVDCGANGLVRSNCFKGAADLAQRREVIASSSLSTTVFFQEPRCHV